MKCLLIKASGLLPILLEPNIGMLSVTRTLEYRHSEPIALFSVPSWLLVKDAKAYVPRKTGNYVVVPRINGMVDPKEISLAEFTNEQGLRSAKCQNYLTSFPLNVKTAWLLGLYAAEGCSSDTHVLFCLGEGEQELAARVNSIIRSLGYATERPRIKDGSLTVRFASKLLARAFPVWCGHLAANKRIPQFILFHKDEQLVTAFLNGYWAGDGHSDHRYNGRGYLRLMANTVSLVLALQVQLLAARLGVFISLYRRDHDHGDGHYVIRKGAVAVKSNLPRYALQYLVHPEGHPHGPHTVLTERCILVRIKSVQEVSHPSSIMDDFMSNTMYLMNNMLICNGNPTLPQYAVEPLITEQGFFDAKEKKKSE